MQITDYSNIGKIIVFDESQPYPLSMVAMARKTGIGPWILRIYRASWADTATNTAKIENAKRHRIDPFASSYLKMVDTKPQAMNEMKGIAKLIAGEIPAIIKR